MLRWLKLHSDALDSCSWTVQATSRMYCREHSTNQMSGVESVLMLIDSVSSIDPSAVSQFREKVCGFTVSASGLTRVMSRAIVRNCGWPEPATSRIFLPVPPIYSSIRLALNQELVRKVAPYDQELKLISEVADVPVGNLHRRVEDIMHQIAPRGNGCGQTKQNVEWDLN